MTSTGADCSSPRRGAMAAGVGLLATLTGFGLTTPAVLLMLLVVIGCGQALTALAQR